MRAGRLLLAVLATVLLGACRVDTTVGITVQADGSGEVTLTVVADKAVVDQAPGLASDLRLTDAIKAGWTVTGPTADKDGGLTVVVRHSFTTPEEATRLLASISGKGGPLHDVTLAQSRSGGQLTTSLAGTLRVDGGLDAFADPDVLTALGATPWADQIAAAHLKPTDAVTVAVSASLPGTPVAATGSTVPAATKWSVPIDGTAADLAVTTRSSTRGGGGGWSTLATAALVGLIAWVAVATTLILLIARARRRRAAARLQY